jgi:histidinol-phosphatase
MLSAPALRERWWGARGLGAWARGDAGERRIHVSRVAALEDAQLLYGSWAENTASGLMPGFDALIAAAWRDRGFGDFWGYALLSEGAAEAVMEVDLKPWDVAAPLVVIEEAGGRATDVHGERRIDSPSFVATNGLLHDEVLRRLAGRG